MFASLAEGILEIRTYNAVNKDMSGWGVLGNIMSVLNVKVSLLTANPSSFKLVPVDSEQFKMCPYWQNLSALKHHMIIVVTLCKFKFDIICKFCLVNPSNVLEQTPRGVKTSLGNRTYDIMGFLLCGSVAASH